jgi:hypothetical protein
MRREGEMKWQQHNTETMLEIIISYELFKFYRLFCRKNTFVDSFFNTLSNED